MQAQLSPAPRAFGLLSRISADRVLIVLSVIWSGALLLDPALPASPDAFAATAVIIGVNFLLSTWKLLCRARSYLLLNVVQFALFGMLNYQLYCAGGPEHYHCEREPGLSDWIEFTGAHVLRAADVLDAIDEYGLDIQHIRHASPAAAGVLILMHLAVDVFLLSLLWRWLGRFWKAPCPKTLDEGRRLARLLFVALALYVGCAFTPGWQPVDWLLWPLDNLLRILDVADAFQIFHWRLHHVRPGPFANTAAVIFRLAASILIGRLIWFVRMVWFTGLGLTVDELIEELKVADRQVRRGAAAGLGRSGPSEPEAVLALVGALEDRDREVRLAVAESLARMGASARPAVPALISALEELYPDVREAVIEALTSIGAGAVPALRQALARSRCSWVRWSADEALRRIERRRSKVEARGSRVAKQ